VNPYGTANPLPDDLLTVLGSTGSTPRLLDLLVAQQRARRLLTLRAVLDAVRDAPAGRLPDGAADRLLRDWRLLEEAERADPAAAWQVVYYPHTGAWAERCLRALVRPGRAHLAAAELTHLAALAASAAARAGLRFSTEVPVRRGELCLPTLGSHRPPPGPAGTATRYRVTGEGSTLWLIPLPAGESTGGGTPAYRADSATNAGSATSAAGADTARPVEVRRASDGIWRSAAPGWHPLRALPGADGRPVLLDDTDPYRDVDRRDSRYGLDVAGRMDGAEHACWRAAWRQAQPWLRSGDGGRAREVGALLDCFVPLAGAPVARCSATRGEAFGALLTTTPQDGLELAATLVHELHHAKLLAVSQLTVLHTAGDTPGYWAPWRPDPRPFDGLFQGAFAHLALAGFHLRAALTLTDPVRRDAAWAAHCRCRQQVGMALPQLLGARALTPQGRTLVNAMAAQHTRLMEHAPPQGHLARATAYVETARVMWSRQRR
jgi:HEXXH motif-containing protein